MKLRHLLPLLVSVLLGVPPSAGGTGADEAPPPRLKGADDATHSTFQKDILPFLKAHCFACHGNGKAKADLSFDKHTDDTSVLADRKVFESVQHMLKVREMPPAERPQPKPAEVEAVSRAI